MGERHRLSLQSEICLLCRTDHRTKLLVFCQLNSVVFDLGAYSPMQEKGDEMKRSCSTSQQVASELCGPLCFHQHHFLLWKIQALVVLQAENKCAF